MNSNSEESQNQGNEYQSIESQKCNSDTPEQSDEEDYINESKTNNYKKPGIDILSKEFYKNISERKEKQEFVLPESSNKKDVKEEIHSSSLESDPDIQQEENNPYSSQADEWLEAIIKRNKKNIEIQDQECTYLLDEIEKIKKQLRLVGYGVERRSLERQLDEVTSKHVVCEQNLEALQNQVVEISKELERRKKDGNEYAEHSKSVSPESLLMEEGLLENTVLYVVTFFPELSLSDFKRIVARFLAGRKITVTKSQTIIEDGKTRIIEIEEEQDLVKKWEESVQEPQKADKTLKKCQIKVRRKEYSLIVDFSLPYLRTKFIKYFHEEQPFYMEEQYKHIQGLLFDVSDDVANSAINLLAEAAIYYPQDYGAEWLSYITATVESVSVTVENINSKLLFERISKLIYQMQIVLETAQSQVIIKNYLEHLLKQQRDYVFDILLYLMNRQLRSNFLISKMESSKQLLDWLKQVLDNGKKEQKAHAYNVLETLLKQRNSHKYIYDVLVILKTWLPDTERSPENYSPSNQAALLLLVSYYGETASKFKTELYGCWPSKYVLFIPLRDDSDVDSKLSLLISPFLQQSANQGLAINSVLPYDDAIKFLGSLIAEWFNILYGLEEETNLEAINLADSLLKQVVIFSKTREQRNLVKFWAMLANQYLEEAANYAKLSSTNNLVKHELVCRRKLLNELRTRFCTLQEALAVE